MSQTPGIYEKLARSLAPGVFGPPSGVVHDIKKAVLLMLVGGVSKRTPEARSWSLSACRHAVVHVALHHLHSVLPSTPGGRRGTDERCMRAQSAPHVAGEHCHAMAAPCSSARSPAEPPPLRRASSCAATSTWPSWATPAAARARSSSTWPPSCPVRSSHLGKSSSAAGLTASVVKVHAPCALCMLCAWVHCPGTAPVALKPCRILLAPAPPCSHLLYRGIRGSRRAAWLHAYMLTPACLHLQEASSKQRLQ